MNIDDYLLVLLQKEGEYSFDKNDRGGETAWGVTVAVARAFGYTGPMMSLTQEQAKEIYKARYWTQPRFDQVALVSPAIAYELFDTGVNMGQATAGKFLQRALNVLNNQGQHFQDVTVDGAIGAMTIAALKAFIEKRGQDGTKVLLRMLNAQQSVRYIEIAERDAAQESFQYGWQFNRVE